MNVLMKNIGVLSILIATIFLSTKSIWTKLIYLDSLDPVFVLACRAILSLPFFLIPIIRFDWCIVNKKKFAKYAFIGSILYLISSIADFVGLLYISASLERAILFTFPIYVLLLSSDLKRLTAYQVMLIIFTVLGLAVMFNPTLNNDINDIVIGGLLVFVSAVFWAIFIIYSKKVVTNISPVIFTSSYMCITTIFLLCILLFNTSNYYSLMLIKHDTIIYLALLAILCSIIPSYLLSYGLKRISASSASIISSIGPIVTLALDVLILNHKLSINEIIGVIIVIICVSCLIRINK